jgi:DNA-binding NarL/FixJ family response regulator
MGTIKVIIADDHEIFLDGLEALLKKQPDIEVVATASNGAELLRLAKELHPEVVMTDIKMPVQDGIEATKEMTRDLPYTGVIALSMFDEENLVVEMMEAGAKGYLLKNAHKQEIINAIQSVYKGQHYYCSRTSSKLIKMISNSGYRPNKKGEKPKLSEREISIIKLICQEHSTRDIADKLALSARTVEGYRVRIEEKINAKNMAGIVLYAVRHGYHKL